jgi:CRISPR-associated protein Csx17
MNEIVFSGCTQMSLTGYLKALGILRLVSEQADNKARGYWKLGNFVIRTELSKSELLAYFLNKYTPSPIISPWSGRAGFLEGDDAKQSKRKGAVTINRIERSNGLRFGLYRRIIASIRSVSVIARLDKVRAELKALEKLKKSKELDEDGLNRLSVVKREDAELKSALLLSLRGELEDMFLPWIDACFALAMDKRTPGPLLGSGGNEGSMDFSINHVGYLLELIDENSDEPTPLAKSLLSNSLYGETIFANSASNIGFLDTLATGGVNMSTGFEGHSSGNTWDSVLAMEGAVLFASSSTKKLESTGSSKPSFPFSVSPSYAGQGSIAGKESARPELWLPVWNAPVSATELMALLTEGRATLGRNQVNNGIDILQSLSSLGINRGIAAFERYGFYERRGQGYYVAAHLGEHKVLAVAADDWIFRDLGHSRWLSQFRKFAQGEHTADRFLTLHKRLEDRLFVLSGRELSMADAQSLLILLSEIQAALSIKALGTKKSGKDISPPVPRLSERWVQAADDGTPAYRIARALAGLQGTKDTPLPLRAQWFPVHPHWGDTWMTPEYIGKHASKDPACRVRIYTARKGRLPDTLTALFQRRLWLAGQFDMQDKPLGSPAGATLNDITAFLRDDSMDARIAALLPGLCLCDIPRDTEHKAGDGAAPAGYAMLKLCLTPGRTLHDLGRLPKGDSLPVPPGMLAQLVAGNADNRAVERAWRRLRASGLVPIFAPDAMPELGAIDPRRVAAALLIPLRFGATGALVRCVLEIPETESA